MYHNPTRQEEVRAGTHVRRRVERFDRSRYPSSVPSVDEKPVTLGSFDFVPITVGWGLEPANPRLEKATHEFDAPRGDFNVRQECQSEVDESALTQLIDPLSIVATHY